MGIFSETSNDDENSEDELDVADDGVTEDDDLMIEEQSDEDEDLDDFEEDESYAAELDDFAEEHELTEILTNAFRDHIEERNPVYNSNDLFKLSWGEESHLWVRSPEVSIGFDDFGNNMGDNYTISRKFGKKIKNEILMSELEKRDIKGLD